MKAIKDLYRGVRKIIERKIQQKATEKFLTSAIPMGSSALLITEKDPVLCRIAGYVYSDEYRAVLYVILAILNAESAKRIKIDNQEGFVCDLHNGGQAVMNAFFGASRYTIVDHTK